MRRSSLLLLSLGLVACSREAPAPAVPPVLEQGTAVDADSAAPAPEAVPEPLPAPTLERYAASHILVAYRGAVGAPADVGRTREEARARAMALREQVLAGHAFEALARTESDGPSKLRGGRLGVYRVGTMVPDFEAAVASVDVGAIGPLVQTPFGFHVVRRDAVVEARVAHVLISYDLAHQSASSRTKEAARARAEAARQALRDGVPFAKVAAEYSDDVTAKVGGELGLIAPGQMIPAFEEAAFALDEGGISEIVESPYGFHIILREPAAKRP